MHQTEPSLLETLIPVPFIYDSKKYHGYDITETNHCKKCKLKDCFLIDKLDEHIFCSEGFSCYAFLFQSKLIILYGLIDKDFNDKIRGIRRKNYRSHFVNTRIIKLLKSRILKTEKVILATSPNYTQDSISFLHDIRTSVGIVLSWCQQIIDSYEGENFDQKLKNADNEMVSLFQSIDLLQEQLNLTDIIANPESISYGNKNFSDPYGFLYKMSNVFRPKASKKNIKINLSGRCRGKIHVYNSFQLIPLILIDNAIKYSFKDRDINIHIEESKECISLKFSSYGNIVAFDNRSKIFEKYFRGEKAKEYSSQGMGLGLYLAKEICEANNSKIEYSPYPINGEIGKNDFTIKIKSNI